MTLIEGIGDEVLIWTSALSIFIILLIWSTCTAENFGEGFNFLWAYEDSSTANNQVPTSSPNSAADNSENVPSSLPQETTSPDVCNTASSSVEVNEPTLRTNEENSEKTVVSVSENGVVLNNDAKTSPSKVGKDFLRKRRLEFYLRSPDNGSETLNNNEDNLQSNRAEPSEEEESESEEESEPVPVDTLQVRLKYLNDTESLVRSKKDEKLGEFRRRHFSEDIANDRTVRLIFNGQLLSNEDQTLGGYGIKDNSVVHVQISQNPPQQRPAPRENDSDLELYMWPLFVIILIFFWMLYFQYKELFNPTSTVTLVILTVLLFIAIWGHTGQQSQRRQT